MIIKEIGNYERAREIIYGKENSPYNHILSINDPGQQFGRIPFHQNTNIKQLQFYDTIASPTPEHVKEIIRWAEDIKPNETAFIHCTAGISRSTAAGIVACYVKHVSNYDMKQIEPVEKRDIDKSVDHIFKIRPQACPNAKIIFIADKLLDLRGNLVIAVEERINKLLIPLNLTNGAVAKLSYPTHIYDEMEIWWKGLDEKTKTL